MSGHSKWSQIKRQKHTEDQKRSEVFGKLSKAISFAVREGGGVTDPAKNTKLRIAIEQARSSNMPKHNIERAIKKISKKRTALGLEEVFYEGYGPFGVALIIKVVTDNRKRASAQIKHALEKSGGHLSNPGSASYLFKRENSCFYPKTPIIVEDKNQKEKLLSLIAVLESLLDVEKVYTNFQL